MRKISNKTAVITIIALALNFVVAIQSSSAASLTGISDVMTTMKASTAANHVITFTTATTIPITTGTITIVMGANASDYDLTTVVAGDITVSPASFSKVVTAGTRTITLTATAAVTPQVITVTIGNLHMINGSNAGSIVTSITTNAGDSGKYATNFNNDVVTVDATVNPTLTFAINNNTLHFGTLSTTTSTWATTAAGPIVAKSSGHTMTVGTNATSGYTITYSGQGLKSGANEITAMGAGGAAPVNGTAQFGIGFTTAGSATIPAAYNSTNYGYVNTGAATQIASLATPVASEIISAYYIANISSATPAGSYSTAITYIATGNF